jgi:DNA polymerase III delta prime subunit
MMLFEDDVEAVIEPQKKKPSTKSKAKNDEFAGLDLSENFDDVQDLATQTNTKATLPNYEFFGNGMELANKICSLFYNKKLPRCILLNGIFGAGKSYLVDIILSQIFANYGFVNDQTNPEAKDNNPDILYVKNNQKDKKKSAEESELKQGNDIKSIYKNNLSVVKDFGQTIMPFLMKSPQISDFKFLIIDNIDYASKEFTNSILKTLEEANFSLYIILVSHNTSRVLKTILSRSIVFNLQTPSIENFAKILEKQDCKLSSSEVNEIYDICDSSPAIAKILVKSGYKDVISQGRDLILTGREHSLFTNHDLFDIGFLANKVLKQYLLDAKNTDFYKASSGYQIMQSINKILQNAITYNSDEMLAKIEIARLLKSLFA